MTTGNHGLCAVGGDPILSTSQFEKHNLTSPPLPLHRRRVRLPLGPWPRADARARRLSNFSKKPQGPSSYEKKSNHRCARCPCTLCAPIAVRFPSRSPPPFPNRFRRFFVHSSGRGTPLRAGRPPLCSGVAEPAAAGTCRGLPRRGVFPLPMVRAHKMRRPGCTTL